LTAFSIPGKVLPGYPAELDKMRSERHAISAFFSSTLAALLAVGSANAALLFQDRHADSNGQETIYRFEANGKSAASTIEQSKAIKVAKDWAAQYYGINKLVVANTQERTLPIHYWLIAFTAPGQTRGGTYYSIVLPDGSVVEPKVSRQGLTALQNPIDVTKDTELQAPVKGLEVHGDIVFEFGWGKGLRCYGPYAPGPYIPGPIDPPTAGVGRPVP
jgi:hypothetical protein